MWARDNCAWATARRFAPETPQVPVPHLPFAHENTREEFGSLEKCSRFSGRFGAQGGA
jgi:hypothetical protein